MPKIQAKLVAALSILNSSGVSLGSTKKVAVLVTALMLYKIKSNPMHHLKGALPLPYVPVRVSRGALVAHRHSLTHPRCRASQYRRTFVLLSVSCWNDLSFPVFDGVAHATWHRPSCHSQEQ